MSDTIGEFISDSTNGEPGKSSDTDGDNNTQIRDSGNEGYVSKPPSVINGYESFDPNSPATERIADRNADGGNGGSQPRLTKRGKIDRRTKAGRAGYYSQETSGAVDYSSGHKLISLEKAILSLHDMAAGIFQVPELMLSEQEAKALNDAVLDVSKYYVSAFDPKKVAIFNLVTCMGGIYATRIMAYRHRVSNERKGKFPVVQGGKQSQQTTAQDVQPIRPENMERAVFDYFNGNPPVDGAAGF